MSNQTHIRMSEEILTELKELQAKSLARGKRLSYMQIISDLIKEKRSDFDLDLTEKEFYTVNYAVTEYLKTVHNIYWEPEYTTLGDKLELIAARLKVNQMEAKVE